VKKLAPKWKVAARIAVVVVGLDIAMKLLVLALLDEGGDHWFLSDSVCFSLNINEDFLGHSQVDSLSAFGISKSVFFFQAVFMLVGAFVLTLTVKETARPMRKFLLGVGMYWAASGSANLAALLWREPLIGDQAAAMFRGLGVLFFLWILLGVTKNRIVFFLLVLLASADLANGLNYLYFPRGVIDFVYFPALEPFLGTTNFADLVMTPATYLLFPAGAALAICGIILRVTKRPETRVGRICAWVLRAHGDGSGGETS
jgi:lipoprotein signal peptidase